MTYFNDSLEESIRQCRNAPMIPTCLSLLAVLLLIGCGGGPGAESETVKLEGRSFTGEIVDGKELVQGSTLRVTFEEGRIGFDADCNLMSAPYELVNGHLELTGEIIGTLRGCPPELMAQDQWLTEFFSATPSISVLDEQSLRLEGEDATIELTETD